jgi:hypothetical protein
MSEFDDNEDSPDFLSEDSDREILGITSIEDLQTYALQMFGKYLTKVSGKNLPPVPPDAAKKFLPLQELEMILRDHGREGEAGFAVGGDTIEEAHKNVHALLYALLSRILSNVLQQGVADGLLDCEFDTDKNDFGFGVTSKGIALYGRKNTDEAHTDNREGPGID